MDFRNRVDNILKKLTKTFGESVDYFPSKGGYYTINAVFDNNFETVDPETEQIISSNSPMIGVNLNDLDFEMKVDDIVKVRNLKYRVVEVREDGQGGASLFLHKCQHGKKVYKKKSSRSS